MALPAPASSFPQKPTETEIESQYHHDASAASTSTAADGSSSNYPQYSGFDVFINNCSSDVRKTFASHLYRRLLSHGLTPFLDSQELQLEVANFRDQIKGAIASASVHVAIFSHNYAESKWCLEELLQILKSGAPIIPVFYHVKPADIRWTQAKDGPYAQALRHLENQKTDEGKPRYDSTTVENWRKALATVADIDGFVLDKDNDDEGVLLDRVVERVLKQVKKPLLKVADYPTGLHEKIKDLESTVLLQQHNGEPQVVGIVGLGGIGKTTLAKEFFNRNCSNYLRSYFLSDIRENARKNPLSSLQRNLVKGLTGLDYHIDSVDEGIYILKRLSLTNVLLILDDVDDVSQVEAFSPVLQSNSLILITSRDKYVLISSGVKESAIYKLSGLNRKHSRELFCSYAFCQPHPLPGFEGLVESFIRVCDGIPLTLKVFGGLLCGNNDKSYWEDHLDRLQKVLPHEIQLRLKISYDALHMEEKQMFLDIACFFIGKKKDMAIRIWNGSGWNGLLGFQNLQNKCLVEVGSFNEIQMHDLLKDMGREIAQSGIMPRRLLLKTEIIDDLLQQLNVGTDVRGIRMLSNDNRGSDDDSSEMRGYKRWSYELFGRCGMKLFNRLHSTRYPGIGLRNLQLLEGEGALLEQILRRVQSPNLKWLRWYKCPYSLLPTWISMKNLRVLEVRGNKLQALWHAEHQAPLQLRELDIVSPLSKLPKSIGYLKHMELFVLKHSNLKTLPDEFCYLRSLKRCELTYSLRLTSLPDSFGDLLNLEYIDLSYSSHLHVLPDSFGHLIHLKYLYLRNCYNLTISSRTFKHISTLECIDLSFCTKIEELPLQVAHQRSLEKLCLEGTNLKLLPSVIGELSNLEVLELGCPLLEKLLPSLGDLMNLRELRIFGYKELKCLPESVGKLTQLTELQVKDCNALVEVELLPTELRKLELINCSKLKRIEGLYGLAKLQFLDITGCEELEELPSIETLVSLEELQVSYCVKLKRIKGLAQLTKLRALELRECSELEALPDLEHLMSLEKLNVEGCTKLQWSLGVMERLHQPLEKKLPGRLKALEIGKAEECN